jgi:F0F1-type ATP synthase epsilon subunit
MFDLILICDEKKIFEGAINEVNVLTENSPVTILPQHQPYMAKIHGEVSYTTQNLEKASVKIKEGFIYTNGTVCFVVVDP